MRTTARGSRAASGSRSTASAFRTLHGVLGLVGLCFLAGFLAGCREEQLRTQSGTLAASASRLDFADHYPGQSAELTVSLLNRGRAPLQLELAVTGADGEAHPSLPFSLLETPELLTSGGASVRVRFSPTEPGTHQAQLTVRAERQLVIVDLQGTARTIPDCPPRNDCHTSRFDAETGTCVEAAKAEGASCGGGNACLLEGTCRSGVCVGKSVRCDDGNACTMDVCDPLAGCQHPPAPPCPGRGICEVGVCDPEAGCGLAPADDGTQCGALSCDAANVCIGGACVVRNPPDGFTCAEASPCQAEGRCQGSTCVRPSAVPLSPSWQFDSKLDANWSSLHDFVLEPDGAVSMMGFFEVPKLRANRSSATDASTFARRCLIWGSRLVCADYGAQGVVGAVDLGTGLPLWTYDFTRSRPDLAQVVEPGRMFMARVAVMAPDRIAALFEAYPRGTNDLTQCRAYFVAVLDAQGREVLAHHVKDPLLDVCNHPHPFGVASDVHGNLFLSFSPTTTDEAPLYAGRPTLLISYSRDGAFKWKRTEPELHGGELAVANGLLFPERSATAYQTNTGQPISAVTLADSRFGRVGISERHVIPSPLGTFSQAGTKELVAYHFNGARAWTHTLPASDVFISDQLRLAAYRPNAGAQAKTVALVFRSAAGLPALTAVDVTTGQEAWSCPVTHATDTSAQLFEVARGQLTLMENAQTCGHCDPPFANSRARFVSYGLSGVEPARVPWSGAFGGADHDHHEDAMLPAVAQ